MKPSVDTAQVRQFSQRISERIRHLRTQQPRLPSAAHPFAASIMEDLEESAEELRTTYEELRAQNEELSDVALTLESERARFQSLFQIAPTPLLSTDAFGSVREGNRAAARLLGIGRDRLRGKPLAAFLSGDSARAFRGYLGRVLRMEAAGNVELELCPRGSDRATVSVSARATALTARVAGPIEFVWTLTPEEPRSEASGLDTGDLAGNREARFLARSVARLNARLDPHHVADAVARIAAGTFGDYALVDVADADGTPRRWAVAHADPALEPMLEQALGPARPEAAPNPAVARVLATGTVADLDGKGEMAPADFLANAGALPDELRPVHVTLLPLPGDGGVRGVLTLVSTGLDGAASADPSPLVLRAICGSAGTALANALRFEETSARARRAEERERRQERTLAALSHEIRTPLNSILGYAELLLEGVPTPLPEGSRRYMHSLMAGARHVRSLVEDVLSLHREEGSTHVEDVEAAAVLRECAGMFSGLARTRDLSLELDGDDGLELRTDRSKLRQILINLLGNALKFTEEGTVSAAAREEGDRVVFTVRDTGPGIDPSDLEHVFEPFWRSSRAVEHRTEGTGLGLALVHALTERLEGTIEVDSELGRGTVFRVALPRSPGSA